MTVLPDGTLDNVKVVDWVMVQVFELLSGWSLHVIGNPDRGGLLVRVNTVPSRKPLVFQVTVTEPPAVT
jgi:hypothetical protein